MSYTNDPIHKYFQRQNGAATLFTSVILMLAGTILAFISARTVLNETKLTANDARNYQAFQAAQGAIDAALNEFNSLGKINTSFIAQLDDTDLANYGNACTNADSTDANEIEIQNADGTKINQALYYYSNETANGDRCAANGGTTGGTLTAVGWSDDCSARRNISVCLGVLPVFDDGGGPQQPVISAAGVGFLGNASVVNRYSNITIWTGGDVDMNSAAIETYIRDTDSTLEDLDDPDERIQFDSNPNNLTNVQKVSNRNSGTGIDIVDNDPSLGNLVTSTGDATEFWKTFFAGPSLDYLYENTNSDRRVAPLPNNSSSGPDKGKTTQSVYVVKEDVDLTGGGPTAVYGDQKNRLILIVDGDLKLNGGTFYGLIYVTGEVSIAGSPTIYGSLMNSSNTQPSGSGTPNIIYYPMGGPGEDEETIPGTGVIIPGSWRDW